MCVAFLAYLWVRSDPCGHDTFLHCDADTLARLPAHLVSVSDLHISSFYNFRNSHPSVYFYFQVECGQWEPLRFLLCSYYFLYANVRHGLLHSLMENYRLYSMVSTFLLIL